MVKKMLFGVKIVVDKSAFEKEWVFPKEKFVEFEKSDEWWCRKYGVGKEIIKPLCYFVGNYCIVHPLLYDEIKKQVK